MKSIVLMVLLGGAGVVHAVTKIPREGILRYSVHDAETGDLIPCKLTFVGVSSTPTPEFTSNDIGRQEGDAIAAFNRLMSIKGEGEARLPLGVYDVYVSRGPEWTLFVQKNFRMTGSGAQLTAKLS